MSQILTIQPVPADGIDVDMPHEYAFEDLAGALDYAHLKMRAARGRGATITVEDEDGGLRWLVTHPDGEGDRFTITDAPRPVDTDARAQEEPTGD